MKRNTHNIKKLGACLLMLMTLGSCEDYLEETQVATLTYDHYTTQAGMEDLVRAAYEKTRIKYERGSSFMFFNYGVDTYTHGDQPSEYRYNVYNSDLNSSEGTVNQMWTDWYDGINRCNLGIKLIPGIEGTGLYRTEEGKNQRIAELRFLRGFYYFGLVQQFGAVPLLLEPSEGVKLEFTRTPVPAVYEAIINDLRFAAEHLPLNQSDYGRATKGAAEHYLAKVYLTRGSAVEDERGQKPTDMDSAAYYAESVINSGVYQLEQDFADLWDINNRQSVETVFSTQFNSDPIQQGARGNWTHLYFIMYYDNEPGMKRDVLNGRPYRRVKPTDYTLDVFDRKNDSRFYKSFKLAYISNNAASIPSWTSQYAPSQDLVGQPKYEVGDTAVYLVVNTPETALTQEEINRTPYKVYARYYTDASGNLQQGFSRGKFPTLLKHLDPLRPDINERKGSRDGVYARLGETYLIAAEAYGRMGNLAKAFELVNVLRQRAAYKAGEQKPAQYWQVEGGAKGDQSSTYEAIMVTDDVLSDPGELYPPTASSTEQRFIHFMLNERARELSGEFHRWEDLVRTELLIDRARHFNQDAVNIQDYHKLRPIPQSHLDRIYRDGAPLTPDAKAAEQNPGY
ncbi:RagB/SusD family nutrient uptake outer membrane protein [Pontibacter korlensis]|uniref:RagB/SusD family nutrient uptake outer membrane protein n=1 Tax=Pontibacter korlensis TaxID=400092 RepID=A0A0E3ZIG8_9BACT|nr:RagB/SusD family nutrient uptake outer membrane protein [Pontibacter korlensis]AKD05390.1 hypothetical protein PKOR_23060 [Pontibacter korlensis]